MLTAQEKQEILQKAKVWFRDVIAVNHVKNTQKLKNAKEFNINPFLVSYIATFLDGDYDELSIARALIYPRALGTSITTSFGLNMQNFVTEVLAKTFGSIVPGIDIEYTDHIDGRKKYCQVKLGPNTINKDDVTSIHGHFRDAKNLSKANKLALGLEDLVVAVVYGEHEDVSAHYKKLQNEHHYAVLVGKDFWHHLTGDEKFYDDLIQAVSSVVKEMNGKKILDDVVQSLAKDDAIKKIAQQ